MDKLSLCFYAGCIAGILSYFYVVFDFSIPFAVMLTAAAIAAMIGYIYLASMLKSSVFSFIDFRLFLISSKRITKEAGHKKYIKYLYGRPAGLRARWSSKLDTACH